MRAVVFRGVARLAIEECAEPLVGSTDVLVEVAASGICGSDLHVYFDLNAATRVAPPFIMGHEFSGTVVEMGREVDGLRAGDPVVIEPLIPCGRCRYCLAGSYNVCEEQVWAGLGFRSGGMAERAVVPRRNVHLVPAGVTLRDAALTEPLAVALHAVRRSCATASSSVAIFGAGPIGIAILIMLRSIGVERIAVIESGVVRRTAAIALDPAICLSPSETLMEDLRRFSGDRGIDVAFEAAGAPAAFTDGLRCLGRQGQLVVVALYETSVTFNPSRLVLGERTVTSSMAFNGEFPLVLDYLSEGRVPTAPWVDTIPLDDVEHGFERLRAKDAIKLLVIP